MKPAGYFSVRNWAELQHYKHRDPPWVKLYRKLLGNYAWCGLPDASKGHLIGLWLLAGRNDNRIPADLEWIAQQIGAREPVNIQVLVDAGFIEVSSTLLASCPVLPTLETETERETEGETETEKTADAGASRKGDNPIGAIMQAVRQRLYIPDGKPPRDWNESRCASIAKRKLDGGTPVGEILDAIEGLAILRDSGELDWLKRGHKTTLRALYHTHSGAVPVYTLALNALDRANHHPTRKAKSQPTALGDILGTIRGAA